jgi:hypothetical protein
MTVKTKNYITATIFNNPLFFRGRGDKMTLNATYLGLHEGRSSAITKLSTLEFFDTNGIKSSNTLLTLYGIELSDIGYERLTKCLNHFVSRLKASANNDGSRKTLISVFGKIKKLGAKIRETLIKKRKKPFELLKQSQSVTFSRITGTELPTADDMGSMVSLWSKNGLNTRVKTFLFKFYNNLLGINTRVSHFDNSVDRRCTICKINQSNNNIGTRVNVAPVPVTVLIADESFKHVFLDCPLVRKLHDQFLEKYFNSLTFNTEAERAKFFLYGTVPGNVNYNIFIHASIMLFQYGIWQMKLKKRILSFESNTIMFTENVLGFFCMNKEAREKSLELNFSLCRSINRLPVQDLAPRVPPLVRAPATEPPPARQAHPPAPGIPPAPPWRP